MNNNTRTNNKFQFNSAQQERNLLDQSKLSRLPKLSDRPKFEIPDITPTRASVVVCVGCGGRIDCDNDFQQSVKACRKCLAHYAKIDAAIDDASKRKRREILEKMTGGA
jgi:hypothetical protein